MPRWWDAGSQQQRGRGSQAAEVAGVHSRLWCFSMSQMTQVVRRRKQRTVRRQRRKTARKRVRGRSRMRRRSNNGSGSGHGCAPACSRVDPPGGISAATERAACIQRSPSSAPGLVKREQSGFTSKSPANCAARCERRAKVASRRCLNERGCNQPRPRALQTARPDQKQRALGEKKRSGIPCHSLRQPKLLSPPI